MNILTMLERNNIHEHNCAPAMVENQISIS